MAKIKVAVLMGGKSAEHEISLMTGGEVVKNLNPKKYDVLPITVSKDRVNWQTFPSIIKNHNVDVVFIAMHGPYGEDGTVQGFLELLGVPYTGSGVLASAVGMDKITSRKLFRQAGLNVPKFIAINKSKKNEDGPRTLGASSARTDLVWETFNPPVFVKPHNQGSSVGTSFVKNKEDLKKALKLAWQYSHLALVEEYIKGVEVTASILGNDDPKVLPLTEIVPKKEFFDYEAKYDENLTDEIVPARISQTLTKKAQSAGLLAYQAIGCRGFGRVDMIIRGNEVYVLEVNTIPGLTPVSLFPKAAKSAGISYTNLLDKIIGYSL